MARRDETNEERGARARADQNAPEGCGPRAALTRLGAALVLGTLAGCANMDPECSQPEAGPEAPPTLRVLTYNVGNGDREAPYALRVRDQAYEDHLGERIRALDPDVVFLQEVLSPTACDGFDEPRMDRTCFRATQREAPAKRLLGENYSVACDANEHVECVGVKRAFGSIRGVEPGAFALRGASTEPLPGPACDYLADACDGRSSDCDAESSISSVVVDTARGAMRLIHAHPTAIGVKCLQRQLEQAFAQLDELPTVMAGDWNFDPTRATDLAPAAIWAGWVGEGRRFRSHTPRIRACRLASTSPSQGASLDRVITDFAVGRCKVWSAPTLDDGFDFDALDGGRVDHLAVTCDLHESAP